MGSTMTAGVVVASLGLAVPMWVAAPASGQEARPPCGRAPGQEGPGNGHPEPGPSDEAALCEEPQAGGAEATTTTKPTTTSTTTTASTTTSTTATPSAARTAPAVVAIQTAPRIVATAPVVAAAPSAAVPVAAPPAQSPDTLNCENFTTQEAAQAALDREPTDPHRLDEDGNGLACENLPRSPTAGGATATTRPAATATTRAAATTTTTRPRNPAMATTGRSTAAPSIFGTAFILLGSLLVRSGRRRELARAFDPSVLRPGS